MRGPIVAFLILTNSMVFGASITKQQALTTQQSAGSIELSASQLVNLSNAVLAILNNGGTFTISGSTQIYTISAAQNQDIVNNYTALKNNICSVQCAQLP